MRARAICWRRSIMPTPAWRSPASARSWPCSTARAARRSPAMRRCNGDSLRFRGMILRPDGSEAFETSRSGKPQGCGCARRGRGRRTEGARAAPTSSQADMRLLVTRPEADAARTAAGLARARARGRARAAACALNRSCGVRRAVRRRADDQRECGARHCGASARAGIIVASLPAQSETAAPKPRAPPASRTSSRPTVRWPIWCGLRRSATPAAGCSISQARTVPAILRRAFAAHGIRSKPR